MNAPTLVVGLGGAGCKITQRVANLITEQQRKDIAFAVMDTDINDLRKIQLENPFIKTIQTSTKETVGQYLERDTHARDTWFPVNAILNSKTLTEGAGQVRSVSRLSFEAAVHIGKMEPLHEAIQSLYKTEEDKVEQALRVIIVSSLAGGTGSGLILPVALYIKNYLATHFRQSANITRGFFILPEVFFEVIPGQTEQNTLKANAYATLRELDSFLMKGDKTLHKKYEDSVKIEFPRVASNDYDEYNIRPYDFCFLFDAQNSNGEKLNSHEQYLDHAANCIYAQSIGPMNKRSNSSEDNTIRKLAKERGRNRYAGAGASMLIYPYEDICMYIALKWAKESVSSRWLVFDNMYKEIRKENAKKREAGIAINNQPADEFYMKTIETQANQGDAFSKAIVKSCGRYAADGVTKKSDRWVEYVAALKDKVKSDSKSGNGEQEALKSSISAQISELDKEWDEYADVFHELERYYAMASTYVEEVSQTIAYSMFKAPKEGNGSSGMPYQLETYLKTVENEFLHPNAVRYLLIKCLDLMKKELLTADSKNKSLRDFFEQFAHNTFDDPSTDDIEETVDDLAEKKTKLFDKLRRGISADQEEIKQKYRNYLSQVDEYKYQYTLVSVLKEGIDYIDGIVKAFEGFYKTFEVKSDSIQRSIDKIYRKYDLKKGTTAKYVCASQECLDQWYKNKPYTGGYITLDSELCANIYYKVRDYAAMTDKPGNARYFNDLFDDGIIGYFKDSVMNTYGNDIDIDIISAIEKEAVYLKGTDISSDEINQYIIKTINNTRTLSCPYIESPLGEAREPIYACAFNKEMRDRVEPDTMEDGIIRKHLMNYGGTPDEDIPKNMIMFYQSFYGLRANDLSKFAPPSKSKTYSRSGGEYYSSYYELVNRVHPNPDLSKEITPHIDRWWHLVSKMPDLDDSNQLAQEEANYAAFFWGIIGKYIDLYKEGRDVEVYKIKRETLKMESDSLMVSNGTLCDKFYEVLDAISIYPELVDRILDKVDSLIEEDVNLGRTYKDGILMTYLSNFVMKEPGLGLDRKPSRCVIDIPMLMKKSTTPDNYYEEDVIQLLKIIFKEIKKYLRKFLGEKEMPVAYSEILNEQFNLYLEDIEIEKEVSPALYRETLFDRICGVVAAEFDEIGFGLESREILQKADSLRNKN